jgi:hypothetical protein
MKLLFLSILMPFLVFSSYEDRIFIDNTNAHINIQEMVIENIENHLKKIPNDTYNVILLHYHMGCRDAYRTSIKIKEKASLEASLVYIDDY